MKCPMCKETMVPNRHETPEGGWTFGWLCGCDTEIRKQNEGLPVGCNVGLSGQPLRIECGEGKIAVHDGTLDGVPCLSIGNNGTGDIGGDISQPGGMMEPEVELVTVTFTNVESVDVWLNHLEGVKARIQKAT